MVGRRHEVDGTVARIGASRTRADADRDPRPDRRIGMRHVPGPHAVAYVPGNTGSIVDPAFRQQDRQLTLYLLLIRHTDRTMVSVLLGLLLGVAEGYSSQTQVM